LTWRSLMVLTPPCDPSAISVPTAKLGSECN
jgi:hypothetical protein